MIALCEYPVTGTQTMNRFLFRGKDGMYWQKKIFTHNDTEWLSDAGNDKKIDFLVLFNPGAFLEIEPVGIVEMFTRMKHIFNEKEEQGPHRGLFLSLEGHPFFAMRMKTFERLKPNLDRLNLFTSLPGPDVEVIPIPLENTYKTLDLTGDFQAIEDFILRFQAGEYIKNGVIIEDYRHFYVEGMVPIGAGTRLAPGVVIKGASTIGKNTTLYPHVYIENSIIGDNCAVLPGCIVNDSTLENNVQIGPYTHLRNSALVREGAKMGNFVEMKKSTLGKGSKAMHLSYIGDAEVGEKVNIGAGTITCNYDGVNKNKTIIEDNVFIGSGTELVAPVAIRKNSYVAAGSTITEEVPADSLAVARQKQRNIIDWVKRKRKKG